MSSKDKPPDKYDQSAIERNTTEADLNRKMILLRDLELNQEQEKDTFEKSQDYKNGVIVFAAEISTDTVLHLSATLRRMVRLYPKRPIRIEFNSPGGTINGGFHLIDDVVFLGKECPITIAVRGQAASMGCVVLQAAQHRLVGPHAYLMLHRASFGAEGSTDQVEDSVKEVQMYEQRIYEIIAKRSGKTVEFWKKQLGKRRDVWYSADEAVKIGLADKVG